MVNRIYTLFIHNCTVKVNTNKPVFCALFEWNPMAARGEIVKLATLDNLADLATLAKYMRNWPNPSNWPRSLFLANSNIIGAIAVFGRHGVTWGHMAVLAKSRQVTCNLPDDLHGYLLQVIQTAKTVRLA